MKNVLVALALFASVPAFAANTYKFTGSSLPPPVQAKLASSASRALKTQHVGALSNATIDVSRGNTLKATLTGTQQSGAVTNTLVFDAAFKVANTKKGAISVRGIRTTSRAYVGQEVTAPVWNLTADGPK